MMKILLIALAGAAGTLARYWFSGLVQRASGAAFPWGTFAVNMGGCLLFGLVWSMAEERFLIGPQARSVVLVGFMGAFTTYSTYTFETAQLLRDSEWALALGNIALQNPSGVAFLFLGLILGRLL